MFVFVVIMTAIALVAALFLAAPPPEDPARASLRMLAEIEYVPATELYEYHASLAFTDHGAFVATPGGLYRLPPRVEDAPAALAAFGGVSVTRVYGDAGSLYVLKPSAPTAGTATDHALLRSGDGVTFTGLDQGLSTCYAGSCQFMSGTEAIIDGDRIYYAAGGNVLASADRGTTWSALVGFLEPQMCYDPSIALIGDRMLVGGECPLDVAYVRAGRLAAGGLTWAEEPAPVVAPELENRNVQFITGVAGGTLVLAGIEGALLRSWDGGASFEFVIHYPIEGAAKYPYIGSVWVSSAQPGTMAVAGFDKAAPEGGAWLAVSRDYGRTWADVSRSIPRGATFRPDSLSFLEEDPEGRLLAGVVDTASSKVRIFEVRLEDARRRAVRR